jgi:hypothetical protein
MDNSRIVGMKRKKPSKINRWGKEEIDILISDYAKGASRYKIASILGRTPGSVANKIRLLIKSNILLGRR